MAVSPPQCMLFFSPKVRGCILSASRWWVFSRLFKNKQNILGKSKIQTTIHARCKKKTPKCRWWTTVKNQFMIETCGVFFLQTYYYITHHVYIWFKIYIYILYYTINSMHITGYTPYTYIAIPCWHPSPHWYRYVFPKLKNKDLEMEIKDPTTQQMSRFWMKASIFWWRIVVLICALNPQTSTVRGPRLQASGFVGFQKKPPLSRLQNQLWCIRYMKLL